MVAMFREPKLVSTNAAGWPTVFNPHSLDEECSHNPNLASVMRTTKDALPTIIDGHKSSGEQTMVVTPELQLLENPKQETKVQMKVTWKGSQDFRTNYMPDPDACALQAAQQELYWSGHHQYHSLRLLTNQTLGQRCTEATGWEKLIWGTALFQVTIVSEPPMQPLDWKTFQQLEKMFGPDGRVATTHKAGSDRERKEDVSHPFG